MPKAPEEVIQGPKIRLVDNKINSTKEVHIMVTYSKNPLISITRTKSIITTTMLTINNVKPLNLTEIQASV